MGIEEEYLLVAPDGAPRAVAGAVLESVTAGAGPPPADGWPPADTGPATGGPTGGPTGASPADPPGGELEHELKLEQIETSTRPCTDLPTLLEELARGRREADAAARRAGVRIVALGTSPVPVGSHVAPNPRYRRMSEEFALTAREQLTCGCHVHVSVADDDEGVAVVDRLRPWLPVLLALSGNSPFWQGGDSGFASFRTQVWGRWPTAGPTELFGTAAAYHRTVRDLVATGTAMDTGMIYFDARLSATYPTVEIRVGDVCLDAGDAALLGVLARALVETAAREAAAGVPPRPVRTEVLRAAVWRASRSGMTGTLLSPTRATPRPARRVVAELVEHVTPVLDEQGERAAVDELLEDLLARGTGAERQRAWWRRSREVADVVAAAVRATQP